MLNNIKWFFFGLYLKIKRTKYYKSDGEPIRCYQCHSENIQGYTMGMDRGVISERSYQCRSCKVNVGYWVMGSFVDMNA